MKQYFILFYAYILESKTCEFEKHPGVTRTDDCRRIEKIFYKIDIKRASTASNVLIEKIKNQLKSILDCKGKINIEELQ